MTTGEGVGVMARSVFKVCLLIVILLGISNPVEAAYGKVQGYAERGGNSVTTGGMVSTTKVQRSWPLATVTIYAAGTTTLSTIYSDSAGTAKANPFTADANGLWFFFAANGSYDVKFSDCSPSCGLTSPFTLSSIALSNVPIGQSVYNIKDYGAKCDGTTDDTTSIQAAINAAQALIPVYNLYQPQAPAVFIPGGSTPCKVTATLNVSMPIRIYGDGKESSVIYTSATINAPTILINPAAGQSTYPIFQLDHFAVKGPNTISGPNDFTSTLQDLSDGIKVTNTSDITVEITDMRITGMTGNGINLADRLNSPRIARSEIELNSKAGIRADSTAGGFVTNADIDNNYIRDNRIGILWKSTAANLTSGRIHNNLIESNTRGFNGTIGSTDRPSVGLWMYNTYDVNITDNYMEGQWNDIYCELQCNHNTLSYNYLEPGNDYDVVTTNGPATRRGGIYWSGGANNRWIANNLFNSPTKPGGCTNANWVAAGDSILTVSAATNASPIVVTTSAVHNMANGGQNKITIAGGTGNTAANGTFYVNVLSTTTFALYSDYSLQTPVAGNGAYTGSATAVVTQYEGITDNFGLNIFIYNKAPNMAGNAVSITNPFNRHSIYSSDFDAGDGAGRAISVEALWGKRFLLPSFTALYEGTAVGGGAGPNGIEWKQAAAGTSFFKLTAFDNSSEFFRVQSRAGSGSTVDISSIGSAGFLFFKFSGITFAQIGIFLTANGMVGYCPDCTIANPCAGGGTGAIAKRLNGVYVCN